MADITGFERARREQKQRELEKHPKLDIQTPAEDAKSKSIRHNIKK